MRIFAMTFEESPIRLIATGKRWGNAAVAPEQPVWRVNIENLRDQKIEARIRVTVVDPYNNTNAYQRTVALAAKVASQTEIPITTQVYGLHQVRTDVELGGVSSKLNTFSQEGTFIHFPQDTRKATGLNSRWGLWNWNGTHITNPKEDENLTINRMAGARYGGSRDLNKRREFGTKDDWNCDDIHSWSYFNFDGWRYVEFPLPNHEPGDNYRGADTVWWNHNAEGIVDLPVKLTRIIIEQRTHNIYVNDLVELPDRGVQLSNLIAVYDDAESMNDFPVRLQRSAAGTIRLAK